ncbi:MAG: hypothetical protein EAZ85_00080, partial [Bacteroidetes bacterium]
MIALHTFLGQYQLVLLLLLSMFYPEEIEIIRIKTNKILYNNYGYGHEEVQKICAEIEKIANDVEPIKHNDIIEELAKKYPISKDRYDILIEDLNQIAKSD